VVEHQGCQPVLGEVLRVVLDLPDDAGESVRHHDERRWTVLGRVELAAKDGAVLHLKLDRPDEERVGAVHGLNAKG
jgi:hypothetical protein